MNRFDKMRAQVRASDFKAAFVAMRLRQIDRDEERFMKRQLRDAEQRLAAIKERRAEFHEERETRESRKQLRRDLTRSLRGYLPIPGATQ